MVRFLFSFTCLFLTLLRLPAQNPDLVVHLESGFVVRLSSGEWKDGLQLVTDSGRLYGWMFKILDSQGTWSPVFYWDMGRVLESGDFYDFPLLSDLITVSKSSDQENFLYVQFIVPSPGNSGYYEPWSGHLRRLAVKPVSETSPHP